MTRRWSGASHHGHMHGVSVGVAVHGHGADAHFLCCAHHTTRNLASIGNQHLLNPPCPSWNEPYSSFAPWQFSEERTHSAKFPFDFLDVKCLGQHVQTPLRHKHWLTAHFTDAQRTLALAVLADSRLTSPCSLAPVTITLTVVALHAG